MKKIVVSIIVSLLGLFSYCQQTPSDKILITGKVIDSLTKQPIEFATISFKNKKGLTGTTSDKNGDFSMAVVSDTYTVKIEFLSYNPKIFTNKELIKDTNLGVTPLLFSTKNLDEVEVVAQKDLMEFKIDRKIYNASKDIANKGGNAIDVLNNTPSVRVDDENNVIMRGSTATILIDGKPIFGLESGIDILSSIPSNTIDKVELIASSAKYSAGGGGIINLITKKRKEAGVSGSFNGHIGTPDNNGVSAFLNKKTNKLNIFSTISFNNGKKIRRTTIDQTFLDGSQNPIGFFKETAKADNQRNSFLFSIGSDFYIDKNNTLTTSFLVNTNNKNYISKLRLDNFDAANILEQAATRNISDFDDVSKIEFFANYTTKLSKEGRKLSFDFKYDNTTSDNNADIIENITIPNIDNIIQKVAKNQNLDNFLFQVDYTHPISKTKKLEVGYKGTLRFYDNKYNVSQFDQASNSFMTIGGFDDVVNYDEKIHAFYALYSASKDKLSYSLGLRTEISDISIGGQIAGNVSSKNYTDVFPSASIGYEFNNEGYLSIDYQRGIQRPGITQLNPFISLTDERFQSVGNLGLNPYTNNYIELAYSNNFKKLTLISSVYLNFANDQFLSVIEEVGQNTEGLAIFRRTPINSGTKNIIGIDTDLAYRPFKGLRLGAYISPYNLDISNTLNNQYDFNSWVWYASSYAFITLNNGFSFKVDYAHQSPIENKLKKLNTINFVNATISKGLFHKKATVTFKVLDVFNSKWFSRRSIEANANTFRRVKLDQRFNLSFTYRFKQKRRSAKDRSKDLTKDVLEDKQDEKFN